MESVLHQRPGPDHPADLPAARWAERIVEVKYQAEEGKVATMYKVLTGIVGFANSYLGRMAKPNCELRMLPGGGGAWDEHSLSLHVVRQIQPGHELTYEYGPKFQLNLSDEGLEAQARFAKPKKAATPRKRARDDSIAPGKRGRTHRSDSLA